MELKNNVYSDNATCSSLNSKDLFLFEIKTYVGSV